MILCTECWSLLDEYEDMVHWTERHGPGHYEPLQGTVCCKAPCVELDEKSLLDGLHALRADLCRAAPWQKGKIEARMQVLRQALLEELEMNARGGVLKMSYLTLREWLGETRWLGE